MAKGSDGGMLEMKKMIGLLLLSLLLLLLACTPPLTKGYVYDKQYQAASTSYSPAYSTQSCSGSGSKRTCKTIYHPGISYYKPAEYELGITSCSSLQTDGQCQTSWVEVDQNTYDSTRVGSYYGG